MKIPEWTPYVFFGAVFALIATLVWRERLRKKRKAASLAGRVRHADEQFGRGFFSDPKRADIAVRVRRVLSDNLKLPLDGLTPSDRLEDDLGAELASNPDLFWQLEAEFGIKTGVEDLETFEKTLARLITFQDLVEFVEERIAAPPPAKPAEDEDEKPSRAYDLAIRSIPVLCIGGFVIAVVGIIVQKRPLMNLGGLIFLSGFAIWGLANGAEMLRTLVLGFRGGSFKKIAGHPLQLLLMTGLALFFLWMGARFLWGILKNVFGSR